MIDPVLFTLEIGGFTISLYWYGVLVMLGVITATWLTTREFKRRGQDPDYVWDCLLYVLPAGIVGARLWYIANITLGGDLRYIQDPLAILNLRQGGLHYFGAILFGAIAFYIYARKMGLDMRLALDAVSPGLLIGQAIARPANFINQELYGGPTNLPWGIRIEEAHRIHPWKDMTIFPEATTRFHPTFAYEIIWNLFAASLIIYLTRKYEDKLKPGVAFATWLILAGVGRNIIEFFRPDQPGFPGTAFSYSRFVALLMILGGVLLLLVQYKVLKIKLITSDTHTYQIAPSLEERLAAKKRDKNGVRIKEKDRDGDRDSIE